MSYKISISVAWPSFLLFMAIMLTIHSCQPDAGDATNSPEAGNYVSAYTSGVISAASEIVVSFTDAHPEAGKFYEPLEKDYFEFDPPLAGSNYWINDHTLGFKPSEKLEPGSIYKARLKLSALFEVSGKLSVFHFTFQTRVLDFMVDVGSLRPYAGNSGWYSLDGALDFSDIVPPALPEKILRAEQDGRSLPISWRSLHQGRLFEFTIDSIQRKDAEGEVVIHWDGAPADIVNAGMHKMPVPSTSDFDLLKVKVFQLPSQRLRLSFSDPLKAGQLFDGLVVLDGNDELSFRIDGNELEVFTENTLQGMVTLTLHPGIKSSTGNAIGKKIVKELNFSRLKPQISLVNNGVILTSSQGFELPFKAVGLNAVDVQVIRIFEGNIPQFLQVNRINNDYQIRRVGRPVLKHTIDLASTGLDMNVWNFFSVDLGDLITPDPGAIYHVEFAFNKGYSAYECNGSAGAPEDHSATTVEGLWDFEESSFWDDPDGYYWGYWPEGYDWREEDNPCHVSYYNSSRFVKTNILASDIGLIVKSGHDGKLLVAVTDLVTSLPLQGVALQALNFQLQEIGSGSSGADGMAEIAVEGSPFLLVANKGQQKAYLRIDDGNALSVSDFDVGGRTVEKGIRGFLYGERGVWRPGDTLFLNFILDDRQANLPEEHPVIFELLNPFGRVVKRMVKTKPEGNIYQLVTTTDAEAPTGSWTARVMVGGATFTKALRIETVKPNRLKIAFDPGKGPLQGGKEMIASLSVKWLHGAAARNLRTKVDMSLHKNSRGFGSFPGYTFTDPSRDFYPDEMAIFDGKVDELGRAAVSFTPPVVPNAPGMLQAAFTVRAFEEGGDFSTDFFTMDYAPFTTFVGLKLPEGDKRGMLLTDTTHRVEVVTCDAGGKPVQVKNLKAAVYKVSWRWWWNASDNDMATYFGSAYTEPVTETYLNTDGSGRGSFHFRIDYPEWGRYFVRVWDPAGGAAAGKTAYVDWPGWAGQAQREFPGAASLLTFTSDKTTYQAGETATVVFPSSGQGRALLSIESGSEIMHASWVETLQGQTSYSFMVTPEMAPNVYVHITLVQPHAQTLNDAPMRLYGIIPLKVEDPASHITPVLHMADVLEPGKQVNIEVHEEYGMPMTYTLAMVDEGLLDLTRFSTPDPWEHFFAREALGVKTWDLYSHVIGAYGGKIEKVFGIGGDEELVPVKDVKANRFMPVVRFLGPFSLGRGETGKHSFTMPDYVGSVRTMVVAAGEMSYGSAEKTTPVKKPLMLLATMPRVLGPGEKASLPVTVFAMDDQIRDVNITIKTNKMFLEGELKGKAHFEESGDQVVSFVLTTVENTGTGRIDIEATSGKHKATYSIGIDVRNPNPPVTRLFGARLQPGGEFVFDEVLPGVPGSNTVSVDVAALMPIDLDRRLEYLLSYPHGCLEQTISAAFPQLYLTQFTGMTEAMERRATANVRNALNSLVRFQHGNGGLSLWQGGRVNEWVSSYAGHFFLEAEKKGYSLPVGLRSSWLAFQQEQVATWAPEDDAAYNRGLMQAYRLYTLALAGSPDLRAMNRLRETPGICSAAKWRLVSAYMLAGQPELARRIAEETGLAVNGYSAFDHTFGSVLRDQAMILESLCLLGDDDRAFRLASEISEALTRQEWMSTQTTAFCLMSMAAYYKGQPPSSSGMMFSYDAGEGKYTSVRNDFYSTALKPDPGTGRNFGIRIINDDEKELFVTIMLKGIPLTDSSSDVDHHIDMSVAYKDLQGRPVNPASIEQGTDFIAEVRIGRGSAYSSYRDLALTQVFPSGWEIINRRLHDVPDILSQSEFDYRDFRDDRVMTYFSISGATASVTYRILLNAAYTGRYYMPGPQCEAMYDPSVYARRSGMWVEVVKQR